MSNAAPYPADIRAKGWRFELDHERIRQSDTWALASAEQRPWLLMLWLTAWEQTPCGSLPSSDELIAARIGMPIKTFVKNKPVLMRGWVEKEDGRLYNATLTERVLEMMATRRKETDRKALARLKTNAESCGNPVVVPWDNNGTDAGIHPESDTGTGTGTGTSNAVPDGTVVDGKPTDPVNPPASTVRSMPLPCPKERIAERFSELLPMLPRVKLWPKARESALRSRWGEMLREKRWQSADEGVLWFDEFFRHAAKSDFLTGRRKSSGSHSNWSPDFDFLISPKGFTGVREGKYDNQEATA